MTIKWTKRSLRSYILIVEYLSVRWTVKEIKEFVTKTEKVTDLIRQNPYIY